MPFFSMHFYSQLFHSYSTHTVHPQLPLYLLRRAFNRMSDSHHVRVYLPNRCSTTDFHFIFAFTFKCKALGGCCHPERFAKYSRIRTTPSVQLRDQMYSSRVVTTLEQKICLSFSSFSPKCLPMTFLYKLKAWLSEQVDHSWRLVKHGPWYVCPWHIMIW